ncbi:hypothetical protein EXM22_17060 [Oceanispirochaeta crateris]|uniref:Uncharacterized protein n=1 Tax=Oceanispirochaeta crateris TaxID=2518645 RepID=A0A5C1QQG3_9SPIO|nr:outer membrane beta-barrel protein [Oceanispirochaeta crateris]QEN09608.1 hypothetical protein EXM22_17060 [Oceanispirochaeta crateris]
MKKRIIMASIILMISSASASALPFIDFQLGAGYNGFYVTDGDNDFKGYPLGMTAFGGVGYKFFPTLSIGAEYEYAQSWSRDDLGTGLTLSVVEHLPKMYLKFNALNLLTVSALAGVDYQTPRMDSTNGNSEAAFTMGARVAFLFAYAQYLMVFNPDSVDNRISIGAIFSK